MYIVIMGVSFMKKFLVLGLALAAISCSSVYAKESAYNFEHGKSVLISSNDNNDVDFKRDNYRHKEFNRGDKKRPEMRHHGDKDRFDKKDVKRPDVKRHNHDKDRFDKRDNRGKNIKRPDKKHQNFNRKNDRRPEFNKGKDKKQNYKKGNNGNHYGQYKNKSKGYGKNKKNKDKD